MRAGDVLRYTPARSHCREGTAYVCTDGRVVDTYWHGFECDNEAHVLSEGELTTAELVFNTNDLDMLDRYSRESRPTWLTYHPRDRGCITSQHGLQELLFVRKGATPDLETRIDNAREKVERAERALRGAQSQCDSSRRVLAEIEGERDQAPDAYESEAA